MESKKGYAGKQTKLVLTYLQIHFDWALSRGDPPRDIESMGREIERMDRDLQRLRTEIEELDRNRFSYVPMKSIKTHKF